MDNIQPTPGSLLKYSQIASWSGIGQVPPIIPEIDNRHCVGLDLAYSGIETCKNQGIQLHIPPNTGADSNDYPPISLVRQNNPTQAYGIFEHRRVDLSHRHPNWGYVYTSVLVYPRRSHATNNNGNIYCAPTSPEQAMYVAIKKLNKAAVQEYLDFGGKEDPYKEISRMREIGDNIHVLQCIEALQDPDCTILNSNNNNNGNMNGRNGRNANSNNGNDNGYIYIVMPQALYSLKDIIPWHTGSIDIDIARKIYIKLIQIMLHLEKHNICHRDLSPDNFLFLNEHNMVVSDLALSIRIPTLSSQQVLPFQSPHQEHHHHHQQYQQQCHIEQYHPQQYQQQQQQYSQHPLTPPSATQFQPLPLDRQQQQQQQQQQMYFPQQQQPQQQHTTTATTMSYRTLIQNIGNFGTIAWMSPEIFHERIFDGIYTDLWQITIVLYNMVTGHLLYQRPDPTDVTFLYFLLARGLSAMPFNEMAVDVLSQYFDPNASSTTTSTTTASSSIISNNNNNAATIGNRLMQRAMSHLTLHPNVIELFDNVLRVDPNERWSLGEVIQSNFIQNYDDEG